MTLAKTYGHKVLFANPKALTSIARAQEVIGHREQAANVEKVFAIDPNQERQEREDARQRDGASTDAAPVNGVNDRHRGLVI
jgi:hypothetical protein